MTNIRNDQRHHMALTLCRLLLVLIALAILVRPLLVEFSMAFTMGGVLSALSVLLTYLFVRTNRYPALNGPLLLSVCFLVLTPLTLISGGVNSQFAIMVPLVPLLAILTGSTRLALVACVLLIVLILALLFVTGVPYSPGKHLLHAFWLIIGTLFSTCIGVQFDRVNAKLTGQLENLATLDHLTGILNRRALDVRLDQELARLPFTRQPLSLLLLDIDHFKQFNDKYGHAAGDRCLALVGACLRANTRQDDLIARYGGEEFLVVLPGSHAGEAAAVAEKLRLEISRLTLQGISAPVSVTIGLATTDATRLLGREELVQRADAALYSGKGGGRNMVIVGAH